MNPLLVLIAGLASGYIVAKAMRHPARPALPSAGTHPVQSRPIPPSSSTTPAQIASIVSVEQAQLRDLGYGVHDITGVVDSATQAAISQFYTDHRAAVDALGASLSDPSGDRSTIVVLDDTYRQHYGLPAVTAAQQEQAPVTAPTLGDHPVQSRPIPHLTTDATPQQQVNIITTLQTQLRDLGYPVSVTGMMDAATQTSMQKFIGDHGADVNTIMASLHDSNNAWAAVIALDNLYRATFSLASVPTAQMEQAIVSPASRAAVPYNSGVSRFTAKRLVAGSRKVAGPGYNR